MPISQNKQGEYFYKPTLWMRIFSLPANLVHKLFGKYFKAEWYELKDDSIIAHYGSSIRSSIPVKDIKSWSIIPVMGFDVIRIEMNNSDIHSFNDNYNDLINALDTAAPDRKVGSELDLL